MNKLDQAKVEWIIRAEHRRAQQGDIQDIQDLRAPDSESNMLDSHRLTE